MGMIIERARAFCRPFKMLYFIWLWCLCRRHRSLYVGNWDTVRLNDLRTSTIPWHAWHSKCLGWGNVMWLCHITLSRCDVTGLHWTRVAKPATSESTASKPQDSRSTLHTLVLHLYFCHLWQYLSSTFTLEKLSQERWRIPELVQIISLRTPTILHLPNFVEYIA